MGSSDDNRRRAAPARVDRQGLGVQRAGRRLRRRRQVGSRGLLHLLPADRPDPPAKGWGALWDEARRDRLQPEKLGCHENQVPTARDAPRDTWKQVALRAPRGRGLQNRVRVVSEPDSFSGSRHQTQHGLGSPWGRSPASALPPPFSWVRVTRSGRTDSFTRDGSRFRQRQRLLMAVQEPAVEHDVVSKPAVLQQPGGREVQPAHG
jgi:hypothetical protein